MTDEQKEPDVSNYGNDSVDEPVDNTGEQPDDVGDAGDEGDEDQD